MVSSGSDRPGSSDGQGVAVRRPRIGLTTYLETAAWGVWNRQAALVPRVYLDAVVAAGGTPLLLPPVGTDVDVLDALDGLLLVGGADIDPARYGDEPHPATAAIRPQRDEHELRLLRAALDRDLPVLCVCRGAQLLAVAHGGRLHQHLPDVLEHEEHQPAPATFGAVPVTTQPGSRVATIVGPETRVPCYHHQGLAQVPAPLRPTAWSTDGLVEAVELDSPAWVVGVQWHPEEDADDRRLFEAHVAACAGTSPDTQELP